MPEFRIFVGCRTVTAKKDCRTVTAKRIAVGEVFLVPFWQRKSVCQAPVISDRSLSMDCGDGEHENGAVFVVDVAGIAVRLPLRRYVEAFKVSVEARECTCRSFYYYCTCSHCPSPSST